MILAIDPGPEQSGLVGWEDGRVLDATIIDNYSARDFVRRRPWSYDVLAIEMIASYGMAVGKEVFETVFWIGRFYECTDKPVRRVLRRDIKLHLCQSARAKDANIRQALIDRFGPVGTKRNPGKLYGIKGHLWAALAVAVYVEDNPV